jgi:hypothetical protein
LGVLRTLLSRRVLSGVRGKAPKKAPTEMGAKIKSSKVLEDS